MLWENFIENPLGTVTPMLGGRGTLLELKGWRMERHCINKSIEFLIKKMYMFLWFRTNVERKLQNKNRYPLNFLPILWLVDFICPAPLIQGLEIIQVSGSVWLTCQDMQSFVHLLQALFQTQIYIAVVEWRICSLEQGFLSSKIYN